MMTMSVPGPMLKGRNSTGGCFTALMAVIGKHAAGSFWWVELATTDQEAAKRFYQSLLGWQAHDSPMGPDDFYTMFQREGRLVGAAYTLRPAQRDQGVPPHWTLYICVASADEAVRRVGELGGAVLAPAFDVVDFGRMAVVRDPTGAIFSLWQPKKHAGLGLAGPHTFCWADLITAG